MAFFDKSSLDFVHWSLKQWHLSFRWTFRSLLHASWGGTQLRAEHANPVSKTLCSVGSWWEAGFAYQRFWDGQIGQEAIPPCLWCQPRITARDGRWSQSHCLERITEQMQFHRGNGLVRTRCPIHIIYLLRGYADAKPCLLMKIGTI